MVFKRREQRGFWKSAYEVFFPKGGWKRAFQYVKHRLNRLPDPPHRIARGIFAGVLTSFTPFFGFHFVVAAIIAKVIRGNILAGLLATFFGNPLTFGYIAFSSMGIGRWVFGLERPHGGEGSVGEHFLGAWRDLKTNIWALFTKDTADWSRLGQFYDDVFLPYLVGGMISGTATALVIYFVSVPIISRYKIHRSKRLQEKFDQIRIRNAQRAADLGHKAD